uniref:Uncharacterized protein n=1 Tax=Brassica oleracea TaxID=3712 RepID=A0A3P6E2F9_BRAOL|nr:unnamed protein product [Brassica oleracea]
MSFRHWWKLKSMQIAANALYHKLFLKINRISRTIILLVDLVRRHCFLYTGMNIIGLC